MLMVFPLFAIGTSSQPGGYHAQAGREQLLQCRSHATQDLAYPPSGGPARCLADGA